MKKKVLALIVCICVLAGVAVTAAGTSSQDGMVVTRSYLEGTYLEELISVISVQISNARQNIKSAAEKRLNGLGQGYMDQLEPLVGTKENWTTTASLTEQCGECSDTITLSAGSGFLWTQGVASVKGLLIDITEGKELSGGKVSEGHRYVAAAETVLTIESDTAYWSIEGEWTTTSDGISAPEILFEDVLADSPYYDAVRYVVERGLFVGVSDTRFAPDETINRGMMATVLHRFAGEPGVVYTPVFSDVADGKWYTPGVIWAAGCTVVSGMGDGTYCPNNELTYQQVAVMFYNYANWAGIDTTARVDLSATPGGGSVAGWAKEQMSWAVASGIMVTDQEGNLIPTASASRANVAVMLQRFDELVD